MSGLNSNISMLIREATHEDIPAIARAHVDTWIATYQEIFPDEFLKSMTYQKREQGWRRVLGNACVENNFTYADTERLD